MITTHYIKGMSCDGCARKVTKALMGMPGILSAKVSSVSAKALITSERDVNAEEIIIALRGTEYELTQEVPLFSQIFKRWFKKYRPLILALSAVFAWTALRAVALSWDFHFALHDFMGGFFIIFGSLKVLNWKKFAESYQSYDPLAKRLPLYAYVYPALEIILGLAYQLRWPYEIVWNITTIFILSVVTVGISQVLYRKEEVRCACLGGGFKIPITKFTVIENILMVIMAIYMLALSL